MVIQVRTPARLHLGLLDTNGGLGRLYGSIGVAIQHPNVILEAEPAADLSPARGGEGLAEGLEAERVAVFARRFLDRYPLPYGVRLRLKASIPAHVGLGSGTQLALAVGTALARLGGLKLSTAEIAVAMGRGVHSGIGIAAFQQGGFVLDGGHRLARSRQVVPEADVRLPPAAQKEIPPILFHHPFPQDWYFVVVVPEVAAGFSGEQEQRAFETLPQAPATLVEKMSRLLLMKMLPSLIERDIIGFGQALTEVQRLVGDCFAAVQGGRYANPLSERLIGHLLNSGAVGAGQSSWGPTVYGLMAGEEAALRLAEEARRFLAGQGGGRVSCVRADNRGARIRRINSPA